MPSTRLAPNAVLRRTWRRVECAYCGAPLARGRRHVHEIAPDDVAGLAAPAWWPRGRSRVASGWYSYSLAPVCAACATDGFLVLPRRIADNLTARLWRVTARREIRYHVRSMLRAVSASSPFSRGFLRWRLRLLFVALNYDVRCILNAMPAAFWSVYRS